MMLWPASLHRHGKFECVGNQLVFHPNADAPTFAWCCIQLMVGYRICNMNKQNHFARFTDTQLVSRMLDCAMHMVALSLHDYFDKVCRPALSKAFAKDGRQDIVAKLAEPHIRIDRVRGVDD